MKKGEFTEEQIANEKKVIISNINTIEDEQDTQIMYFLGQELSNSNETLEEYKQNIENVSKEQVINIANKIKINTIFFLKSYDEEKEEKGDEPSNAEN